MGLVNTKSACYFHKQKYESNFCEIKQKKISGFHCFKCSLQINEIENRDELNFKDYYSQALGNRQFRTSKAFTFSSLIIALVVLSLKLFDFLEKYINTNCNCC